MDIKGGVLGLKQLDRIPARTRQNQRSKHKISSENCSGESGHKKGRRREEGRGGGGERKGRGAGEEDAEEASRGGRVVPGDTPFRTGRMGELKDGFKNF